MSLRILVLGGTRFLGRHFVEQALASGHRLTLLHRGRCDAALFPDAEHRVADRNGELALLAHGTWDVVLDTSAYVPRQVRSAVERLQGRIGRYLLVSSISVYANFKPPGPAEDAELQTLADTSTETVTGETYGGLKVLCEQALQQLMPEACLIARPGLLVGPLDPTGRFTWWLRRLQAGGDVLTPGETTAPVQFIDARDAAAWLLRQAEAGNTGVFNLTGPAAPLTMGEFLQTAQDVLRPETRLHWAAQDFLLAQGVAPWSDMPVWVPRAESGLHDVDITRALRSGLVCRPLAQTVADTAAWANAHDVEHAGVGLSAERETALLAAWAAAS